MKIKALISFSGAVTMYAGEICEITDNEILEDLLFANYIVPIKLANAEQQEQKEPETHANAEQQEQKEPTKKQNTKKK